MKCVFPAKSVNEGYARMAVAAFIAQLDPPVSVLSELKTAVSEAVTNSIVHGYREKENKLLCPVYISAVYTASGVLRITVKDKGKGIEDVALARTPLYTTDAEGERSGMGFTVMESFADKVRVKSIPGKGTTVVLEKRFDVK
jgi:stage II sporulation protein AB (anti-sigma F factor)